jgi:hypothetical protein
MHVTLSAKEACRAASKSNVSVKRGALYATQLTAISCRDE